MSYRQGGEVVEMRIYNGGGPSALLNKSFQSCGDPLSLRLAEEDALGGI